MLRLYRPLRYIFPTINISSAFSTCRYIARFDVMLNIAIFNYFNVKSRFLTAKFVPKPAVIHGAEPGRCQQQISYAKFVPKPAAIHGAMPSLDAIHGPSLNAIHGAVPTECYFTVHVTYTHRAHVVHCTHARNTCTDSLPAGQR